MESRFKSVICVDIIIKKLINNETYILLMRRKNTGFNDGEYELPGGHVEKNEDLYQAMIREAKEELCINLNRNDINYIYLLHHFTGERLNFIFETNGDNLEPTIGEPNKCDKLLWVNINNFQMRQPIKLN